MDDAEPSDRDSWPLRAVILLGLGGLFGLAIHLLTRGPAFGQWTENPAKFGIAAALAAGGIVFGFSLERLRRRWSILFGVVAGLVVGFVTYWNGQPDSWGAGEGWQLFSALIAVAIAVPLFQAARDAGRRNLDYRAVHAHAWTNIVLWFAAWAFVLVAYMLMHLLAELFQLIGITALRDLLQKSWFGWLLVGASLGAAVGLLRDRDRILGLLQRVVTAVLSVLAPILAVGLVIFVAALPFTGLDPLWQQTSATTPILLSCIIAAVVFVGAAIGSGPEEEAPLRIVRWAAAALAAVILPLGIVAAISTGKRIGQYGYTPDRLWAAVFVAIALAVGLAYLFALFRGRAGWQPLLRAFNLRLALGICLVALLLALPIVSFGAISTRDQLARLDSGRIAPDRFDWAALRFDFGPSGRRAVERLARTGNPAVREHAGAALKAKSAWDARKAIEAYAEAPREVSVRPAAVPLPPALRDAVLGRPSRPGACTGEGECLLFWRPGQTTAIVLMDHCAAPLIDRDGQTVPRVRCSIEPAILELASGRWRDAVGGDGIDSRALTEPAGVTPTEERMVLERQRAAIDRGEVEIREVRRRQLFIGDRPEGNSFE